VEGVSKVIFERSCDALLRRRALNRVEGVNENQTT